MKISFITLFPQMFEQVLGSSILKRAQDKNLVEYQLIDLRDFGEGAHKTVDDKPFGGGVGMVLKPDVLKKALDSIKNDNSLVILTQAGGEKFTQKKARQLSSQNHLIIICGHYEGVDQRFIDKYVDLEISIGDYVLTGGEIPAMVIADSITRLVKGVLEKEEATLNESFENNLLEYPQYTRPAIFEGEEVPEVLMSGNHQEIEKWRQNKSLEITKMKRADLLDKIN